MKSVIKKIIPQSAVNLFWHLPKAVTANLKYGLPSKKMTIIGVTGTDGKTTTVNMIYRILKDAGKKVSMVSTINAVVGEKSYETGFHVTSPHPFDVQQYIKDAVSAGSEYMVLEVTSHALDQFRFWGVKFDIAVLTNVTHEHLDYHKTFENYLNTKLKLISTAKSAVVNKNIFLLDPRIRGDDKIVTFGFKEGDFNQKQQQLKLSIPGEYNIENGLAALAVASKLDIDLQAAKKSLQSFNNLSGRMEEVKNNKGIKIYVDFAHTPNALESALKTLKKETKGKLIAVFGSAGKRDIGKRSKMAEIGIKFADSIVITSEDPRGEWEKIISQMENGALKAGGKKDKDFFIIEDRQRAINFAIRDLAKSGDIVGIFGKGHEKSLNLDGRKEIPWNDVDAARLALK